MAALRRRDAGGGARREDTITNHDHTTHVRMAMDQLPWMDGRVGRDACELRQITQMVTFLHRGYRNQSISYHLCHSSLDMYRVQLERTAVTTEYRPLPVPVPVQHKN